ncbi:Mimivirus related hypothetical protein [Acanthamoeba castellanii str. Neff]|uniref:Glycosyl hydrolase family 32 N-terminal domain-containing protein n=1 Tax=Acanthamoeba castellanii (strain ATCC 30010 / Neff) TaxID=1257118 RepID=L8GFR2_ACACF|nr:Mimivirus related hypothetical protein [Acanthamoeba castellanii str. Neff]ELR11021.1 Mimivirus related hypothetical protein [Acanthamoeba castellanii str. Neff]
MASLRTRYVPALAFLVCLELSILLPARADVLRVSPDSPAILPSILPAADDTNINFPSIIAVPPWLRARGALGAYYMYFSSHKGAHVRVAYADSVEGPWTVHPNGTDITLDRVAAVNNDSYDPAKGHTASPEAWVDPAAYQVRMYYHFRLLGLGHQAGYAYSEDGLHWSLTPGAVHPRPYLRRFVLPNVGHGPGGAGGEYMIDRDLGVYRVVTKDQFSGRPMAFELVNRLLGNVLANLSLINGDGETGLVRHVGVDLLPNPLAPTSVRVYATRIGDAPERIVATRVALRDCALPVAACLYRDPSHWAATEAVEVLRPATFHEGAGEPVVPSAKGDGPAYRVNQLRDPAPYYDAGSGRHYLAYAIGGEFGIALAQLTGADIEP